MFEGVPTYPHAGRFWEIVEKYKVNQFYTAPTAIRALQVHGTEPVEKFDLSSLKVIGSVGEPINEEAWHWYHEHVGKGNCPLVDTWWQTETGGIMISPLAGITPNKPAHASLPLPGVQPVIVDAEGNVSVDMGEPEFAPEQIPLLAPQQADIYQRTVQVAGEEMTISFSALSMGNPHAVIEVEDLAATAVKDIGEALGAHPDFPEGVNVGFMQVLNSGEIKLRVFERGTGETLACGTGACAAVVAGQTRGLLDEEVSVRLAGGYLRIHWQGQGSSVLMTGPATTVYQGSVEI